MPWATSDRRTRLPSDWHARRAATYRRAKGQCEHTADDVRCTRLAPLHKTSTTPAGHADHIDRTQGDDQLQWLCQQHHYEKSAREGHAAMRTKRTRALHGTEQHPGLS